MGLVFGAIWSLRRFKYINAEKANAIATIADDTAIPAIPPLDNPVSPPLGVVVVVAVAVAVVVIVMVAVVAFVMVAVAVSVSTTVFVGATEEILVEAVLETEEVVEKRPDSDLLLSERERSLLWREDMMIDRDRITKEMITWMGWYLQNFAKTHGSDDGCASRMKSRDTSSAGPAPCQDASVGREKR